MTIILLLVGLAYPDKLVTLKFGEFTDMASCQRELRRAELQLPQILSVAKLSFVDCKVVGTNI